MWYFGCETTTLPHGQHGEASLGFMNMWLINSTAQLCCKTKAVLRKRVQVERPLVLF